MSPTLSSFISLYSTASLSIMAADGSSMFLEGVGSIATPNVSLSDVYYVPSLKLNLVSVSQLCASGYLLSFSSSTCCVQDPRSRKVIGTGRRQGGLYVLDELKVSDIGASSVDLSSFRLSSYSSDFYL